MLARQLRVDIRRGPGIAILDLDGEINAAGEEVLNAAYVDATRDEPPAVLLNFENVDYINSTGIALIVGLLAQARKSGRKMMASGLSDHYVEIFQITRLADFMQIVNDEAAALQAVPAVS